MGTIGTLKVWRFSPPPRKSLLRAILDGLGKGAVWFDERLEKRRSRGLLLELTDYQLKDIGVTRGQAIHEARRPFWD
jgi:uncharacterized protein YjiS (DUF1127 family)